MLDAEADAFPMNVLFVLRTALQTIDPDITVLMRPIQKGDPIQAFGITASLWQPDPESEEFVGGQGLTGPTINRYIIGIQSFNQDMDVERGLQVSATMAGRVRVLLSRDPYVRVALASLSSTELGFTERFLRSSIQGQRFLSNEIEGYFYNLTNLEFLVETEIA